MKIHQANNIQVIDHKKQKKESPLGDCFVNLLTSWAYDISSKLIKIES